MIRTLRKITEEPGLIIMEPPSEERINFSGDGDDVIYDFLFRRSAEHIWSNRARLWLMTVLKKTTGEMTMLTTAPLSLL